MLLVEYGVLFAASTAFEFAYVAWGRAVAQGRVAATVAYSVTVAALGLLGIKGALELKLGWVPYLAGIALGAWSSARIGRTARIVPA